MGKETSAESGVGLDSSAALSTPSGPRLSTPIVHSIATGMPPMVKRKLTGPGGCS